MIVSFRDGRVRLRSPALRSETALEEVGRMLAAYAGVKKIETNAYTGSLLVLYDPAMISTEQLNLAAAMLESRFILPAAGPGRAGPAFKSLMSRKIENRLLLGSAVMTLAGAVSGMKPLHITGGALLILFAARHLHLHRKAF